MTSNDLTSTDIKVLNLIVNIKGYIQDGVTSDTFSICFFSCLVGIIAVKLIF